MKTVTRIEHRKQCKCNATASGPRIVMAQQGSDDSGQSTFTFTWVEMACDECDKPWKRRVTY